TGYEEFAIQAIKAKAVDYLLKPIQPSELVQAIDKCVRQIENEAGTNAGNAKNGATFQILVKTARGIFVIHLDDVVRCESEHGYTTFILKDKKRVVASKTLKEIETAIDWPPNFMRVHQSHLINLNHASSVAKTPGGYMVHMTDESDIPVSAANKPQLTAWLNSMRAI
ncbi:MAG TPA: LytTR family DNA-binding domain-containing protein, partial [Saprospiraceae bacterium]|nr:LytTR family DNA-binding domain-containing protein [Saprospiraceae bacterium]